MTEGYKTKIIEKKEIKEQKLLDAAFSLFTEKGFKGTTIQNIVDKAGVAKGTFYLYFKDKYDIQDLLITYKSNELFLQAIKHVDELKINEFEDRIIAIIDYLIDYLKEHEELLVFISKNLSLGVFGDSLTNLLHRDSLGVFELLKKEINDKKINLKNPKITLFMIIELTSSVAFSSITNNKPLPIDEIKPILFDKIRLLLKG